MRRAAAAGRARRELLERGCVVAGEIRVHSRSQGWRTVSTLRAFGRMDRRAGRKMMEKQWKKSWDPISRKLKENKAGPNNARPGRAANDTEFKRSKHALDRA